MGAQFTSAVNKISAADIIPKSLNKAALSTSVGGSVGGAWQTKDIVSILSKPSTILKRNELFSMDSGLEIWFVSVTGFFSLNKTFCNYTPVLSIKNTGLKTRQ